LGSGSRRGEKCPLAGRLGGRPGLGLLPQLRPAPAYLESSAPAAQVPPHRAPFPRPPPPPCSAGRTPVDEALSSGHEALLELINSFDVAGGGGAEVSVEFEGGEDAGGGGEGEDEAEAEAEAEAGGSRGAANGSGGGSGAAAAGGAGEAGQRLAQEAKEKLAF
jgi:hypothetical protein